MKAGRGLGNRTIRILRQNALDELLRRKARKEKEDKRQAGNE